MCSISLDFLLYLVNAKLITFTNIKFILHIPWGIFCHVTTVIRCLNSNLEMFVLAWHAEFTLNLGRTPKLELPCSEDSKEPEKLDLAQEIEDLDKIKHGKSDDNNGVKDITYL